MRRDTTILFGSIIILVTVTLIVGFFASLELLHTQSVSSTNTAVVAAGLTEQESIDGVLVIIHQAPVTIDRFGVELALASHRKINAAAVDTTITLTAADGSTAYDPIHFSGIGEVVTVPPYRFRLVNATESTVQVLVAQSL